MIGGGEEGEVDQCSGLSFQGFPSMKPCMCTAAGGNVVMELIVILQIES